MHETSAFRMMIRWKNPFHSTTRAKLCGPVIFLIAMILIYRCFHQEKDTTNLRFLENVKKFLLNIKERDKKYLVNEKSYLEEKARKLRILCYTMTIPSNMQTKAVAVNNTWGTRCTKLVFVTQKPSSSFDTMQVDVQEGRSYLTDKTVKTLIALYKTYRNDYDWFFKCDDDVYIIMENLRHLLAKHDSHIPVYLGHQFRLFTTQGYLSGGAGYAMNRRALEKINEDGFQVSGKCDISGKDEDLDIGHCFEKLGVKVYSTIDSHKRQSFHPFGFQRAFYGHVGGEMFYVSRPYKTGPECCSEFTVSFHYVTPEDMYLMEFLLYHARIFGRHSTAKGKEIFTTQEAVISDKAPNEVLLSPKYIWHYLFRYSRFE
ncbi:glycoprotein-N-acetylgalactosamine 3-beta-galactosyltransferase 1-like isoform X5 [Ostrea edulis]|uniref:glycoprotein-N-acetylgalactosamine 3-beta-galactosyltransferase 1-like isoform X5 n=1 Tax=Ostrea edulis TaxID=37623 RepID=UPI0024AF147B|nr:glycoprotein-N-acetylgalactosamine 3-beta-galactosyltransferase 1-like isoform X5 [Ostrea edulis]